MAAIFITGISSGLGLALADAYLKRGAEVYGLARRECPLQHENLHFIQADLDDEVNLPSKLFELLTGVGKLDLVILNAGLLGSIADLCDVDLRQMKKLMDVNLWSNKLLVDWVLKHISGVRQIVAVSSGAAVNGNRGWGAYSLSKAALNMLMKLYAAEGHATHFSSLAPGLVDTAMQEQISHITETDKFTSIARIQSCRGTDAMPSPETAAKLFISAITKMTQFESGTFKDIRNLN